MGKRKKTAESAEYAENKRFKVRNEEFHLPNSNFLPPASSAFSALSAVKNSSFFS
jgi:hypothetical protein